MGDWDKIYNNTVNQTLHAYNETRHTIDPDITSGLKQLRQTMIDNYTPNKILAQQEFHAICLKELANVTGVAAGNEEGGGTEKKIKRIKARIPEIHSFLPIPKDDEDWDTLSYYPTFVGAMKANQVQQITAGSEVIVTFANMTNFKDPRLIGVKSIAKGSSDPAEADTSSKDASDTGVRDKDFVAPTPEEIEAEVEKGATSAQKKFGLIPAGEVNCKVYQNAQGPYKLAGIGHAINPLGLVPNVNPNNGKPIDIYENIKVRKYTNAGPAYWSTAGMQNFLKGLDKGTGLTGMNVKAQPGFGPWDTPGSKTVWKVQDLSPEMANGYSRWREHSSHREGNDVDIGLPKLGEVTTEYWGSPLTVGPGGKPGGTGGTRPLDMNRTLMFLIIAAQNMGGNGVSWVFLDKKFHKPLREHAEKFVNATPTQLDLNSAWWEAMGIPPASIGIKTFLAEAKIQQNINKIFGKEGSPLSALIYHQPGHATHFHVRTGKRTQDVLKLQKKKDGQSEIINPKSIARWEAKIAANCQKAGQDPPAPVVAAEP